MEIGILAHQDEGILNEIEINLTQVKLSNYRLFESPDDLKKTDLNGFNGFFIVSIPPEEIKIWEKTLLSDLQKFYKIYYYSSFFTFDLEKIATLYFDFVIVGENRLGNLARLLPLLKNYYWKKIPATIFGKQASDFGDLMFKILTAIEMMDNQKITIRNLSEKLKVNKNLILQEIEKSTGLSFKEFKTTVLRYYEKIQPE